MRRERMKDLQGKMYRKGTLQNPNITVEELEKIEKPPGKRKGGNAILSPLHTDLSGCVGSTGTPALVDLLTVAWDKWSGIGYNPPYHIPAWFYHKYFSGK